MSTIKITNTKRGTTTITGLSPADLRLLAQFLTHGALSVPKDSTTIPLCDAVLRFESALRVAANFPYRLGNTELIANTSDANLLYEELENVS
jgi:hypothetical protein